MMQALLVAHIAVLGYWLCIAGIVELSGLKPLAPRVLGRLGPAPRRWVRQ